MIISYMLIRNHFIQPVIHISKQVEYIPNGDDKKTVISFPLELREFVTMNT